MPQVLTAEADGSRRTASNPRFPMTSRSGAQGRLRPEHRKRRVSTNHAPVSDNGEQRYSRTRLLRTGGEEES
jgi:hypothetical protein